MEKDRCILSDDERTEEADKVSSRIAEILSETANEYISIHRKLFRGFTNMPKRLEIITSQRKNWCLTGQPLCTVALLN